MGTVSNRVILLATMSVLLAGCETTDASRTTGLEPDAAPAADASATADPVATPGLTARERFRKAIKMLESGNAGQARVELEAYLAVVRKGSVGKSLLRQIVTPIDEYYPADNFTVELGDGETLSTVAKDYFGDALQFYALARYNDIKDPSRVSVGQVIRIPATEASLAVRDGTVPETPQMAAAPADVAEESAPSVAEEAADAGATAATPALTGWAAIAATLADGDLNSAVTALDSYLAGNKPSVDQLKAALEAYQKHGASLTGADDAGAARSYVSAGQLLHASGDGYNAFGAYSTAVDLDADNAEAFEGLETTRREVTDHYYREGSAAFRRQELDLAIASLDMALSVDPDHENAKLYRAQAIELKERLAKLTNTN